MAQSEELFPLIAISRLRMGIDGSGVTTLVSGAGCPLNCRYCINQKLLRRPKITDVNAGELYERVSNDDLYYRATGGGITFGGGEALLHAGFFDSFRNRCPDDWRLCAETSLAVPRENVNLATESIDEFIVDCKDMDRDIYHAYCGGNEELMESNLSFLLEKAGTSRVIVRVPLIPDYNTTEDQDRSIKKLKDIGVTRFDVFRYVFPETRHRRKNNSTLDTATKKP